MSKSKEEQNKEKLDTQNKEMQRLYTLVMQNLSLIHIYWIMIFCFAVIITLMNALNEFRKNAALNHIVLWL